MDTQNVKAFGTESAEAPLKEMRIGRRKVTEKDIEIEILVPIPGTTNLNHLKENLGATEVKFSLDEIKQFNTETSAIVIKGARLREDGLLQLSGVEAPAKS